MIKKIITSSYSRLHEDGRLLPKTSFIIFIAGVTLLMMGGISSLLFILFNNSPFLNLHILETSKLVIQTILQSGSLLFFSVFLPLFIIGSYRNIKVTKNKRLQSISSDKNLIKIALNQEITLGLKFYTLSCILFTFFVGILPLINTNLQIKKDIAAVYTVAPSSLILLSSIFCTIAFLLVFLVFFFCLVNYISKPISNLVNNRGIVFYSADTILKNKFDSLPETERLHSLERAKSLGISPSNKDFMKTVLTEYEKRRQTAMDEEEQLNTKTASAPNFNRKQTRL